MKKLLLAATAALSLSFAGCAALNPPATGGSTTGSAAASWTAFCTFDVPGAIVTWGLAQAFVKFSDFDKQRVNESFDVLTAACAAPNPVNTADALARYAGVLASIVSIIKNPNQPAAPNVVKLPLK